MNERWVCSRCFTSSPAEATVCSTCGSPRSDAADQPSAVDPTPAGGEPIKPWDASPPAEATLRSPPLPPTTPSGGASWAGGETSWPDPSGAAPPPTTPGSGWSTLSSPPTWDAAPGVPPPAPRKSRAPLVAGVILGVAAIAAVGFGIMSAAQRDDTGDITHTGSLQWYDLTEGDCFDFPSDEVEIFTVTAIPCPDPHVYEVLWVGDVTDGGYPTDDAFIGFGEDTCIPAFETYVGRDYDTSVWYLDAIWPTKDAWGQGERTMVCYLFNENETPVTGSAAGSGE